MCLLLVTGKAMQSPALHSPTKTGAKRKGGKFGIHSTNIRCGISVIPEIEIIHLLIERHLRHTSLRHIMRQSTRNMRHCLIVNLSPKSRPSIDVFRCLGIFKPHFAVRTALLRIGKATGRKPPLSIPSSSQSRARPSPSPPFTLGIWAALAHPLSLRPRRLISGGLRLPRPLQPPPPLHHRSQISSPLERYGCFWLHKTPQHPILVDLCH